MIVSDARIAELATRSIASYVGFAEATEELVGLAQQLHQARRDLVTLNENLSANMARCSELLEENRLLKRTSGAVPTANSETGANVGIAEIPLADRDSGDGDGQSAYPFKVGDEVAWGRGERSRVCGIAPDCDPAIYFLECGLTIFGKELRLVSDDPAASADRAGSAEEPVDPPGVHASGHKDASRASTPRSLLCDHGILAIAQCVLCKSDELYAHHSDPAYSSSASTAHDPVNHPSHYTSGDAKCSACGHPIECIDVTEHKDFLIGNVLKYLWRADLKGKTLEDKRKAAWYLQRAIEKEERAGS